MVMSYSASDRLNDWLKITSLSDQHVSDLADSGILIEQALAAGIRTVTDPQRVQRFLKWDRPADALGDCLAFLYRKPDGNFDTTYVRVRPDNPRTEKKGERKGKKVKYESPVGISNRAYFPGGVIPLLGDVTKPLIITEGEKKALKATLEGFPAVGLVGVWGFAKKRKRNQKGRPVGERELIDDLADIAWAGREVAIIFDADATHKSEVKQAETALAELLAQLGAIIKVVRLPEPAI
jgi:hypothetical protein